MISYTLSPSVLKTFGTPEKPFLSFDQFINIVQWYRDVFYAVDNVKGFEKDIGTRYAIWTRRATSRYYNHIFFDQLTEDVTITFSIPRLDRNATFPIAVKIHDRKRVYFEHEQEIALERLSEGRAVLSGWKRVPEIRDFLLSQCHEAQCAA